MIDTAKVRALYVSGQTSAEIADSCGLNVWNVKSCVRRMGIARKSGSRRVCSAAMVVRMYTDGLSYNEIATRLGISAGAVRNRLREAGMARRSIREGVLGSERSRRTKAARGLAVEMYADMKTPQAVASAMGITSGTAWRYLVASGVYLKPSFKVPPSFTFREMSPDKAWLVGLIYGDGHLRRNGEYFCVVSGDNDILSNVKEIMGGNVSIRPVGNHGVVTACSTKLVAELRELFHLVSKKSRVLHWPTLKASLYPHFIRGLMDSDGCWTLRKQRRTLPLGSTYTSQSRQFVVALMDHASNEIGTSGGSLCYNKRTGCSIAKWGNADSLVLGEYLYRDSDQANRCGRKFRIWKAKRG